MNTPIPSKDPQLPELPDELLKAAAALLQVALETKTKADADRQVTP
ncbi:MAG: hypothetical protein JNM69_41955 [Archangium sp.]|nr:hypothetical protein [Archangium sp.]